MTILVTTLVLLTISVAFIAILVARNHAAGGPPAGMKCPRCHAPVTKGAGFCSRCKSPLQVVAPVPAQVVTVQEKPARAPLHAVVRVDVCVGCGNCASVCPEPGAIQLVNQLARVDAGLCKGHGECARACPVGGIFLSSGSAMEEIERPELTASFESTSLPGLYVVGELGGRCLMQKAINEGRLAVEHVSSVLAIHPYRGHTTGGVCDVAIVGSGPAGLSAGLEAMHQGLSYRVLEQGTLADTIARYPRMKLRFDEPLCLPVFGDLQIAEATRESLLACWLAVIEKTGLSVQSHTRIEAITKEDGDFCLTSGDRVFRARRVVLAMGLRGTPQRLGVPGEELDKVFYDILEMEAFAGQRMLVVGGGDSALESALGLAHQKGTTVALSCGGAELGRVKERTREKIDAAVVAKHVELLLGSEVKEIRRDVVVLEHNGAERLLPNDGVVVRVGGEAPYPFLERTGVRIVKKERVVQPQATGNHR
jgi:thioredoxin reductase/Pyruvate/2-oxoacid:ferredoxin oxidoreductase delta subunit